MSNTIWGQLALPIVDPLAFARALADKRKHHISNQRARKGFIKKLRQQLLDAFHNQLDLFVGIPQDARKEIAEKWTDEEIVALCDYLVTSALEGLRDFKNRERRLELFEWMCPAAEENVPFSFKSCCRIAGMDAENLTLSVYHLYRDEIISLIQEKEAFEKATEILAANAKASEDQLALSFA